MVRMLLVLLSVFCILFMKYECRAASLTSTGRSSIHNPQKRQPGATADKSISKSFKLNVVSWNMAEKIPDENDCEFIKGYRNSDVVAFGIQEMEDIRPRRNEGHRSRKWRDLQQKLLGKRFKCVTRHKMGGLIIAVYARKQAVQAIQGVQVIDVACGVGNVLTNKGAVCVVLRIKDKTIALINSHLAAHQKHVEGRNADYHRIMDTVLETIHPQWANIANTNSGDSEILVNKAVLSPKPKKITRKNAAGNTKIGDKGTKLLKATSKAHESANQPRKRMYKHRANAFGGKMPTVSPRDGALVTELPFDAVIFFGDLNYRNDLPRLEIERLHNRLVKNAWMGNANKTTFPIYNVFEGKILHQQEQHDSLLSQMKVKFDNRYLRYATSPRKVLLEQQLDRVLLFDQLSRQRGAGAVFQNFLEGSIRFPPTYKYDEKRDLFDSSSKQRCPAWTDRILYYSRKSTSSTSSSSPECVFGNNKDSQDGKTSKLVDSGDTLRSNAGAEKRPTAEQVAVSLSEPIPTPSGNPSTVDLGGAASENDVLQLHDYYSIDARTSDHRPVCADFTLHL